MTATRGYNPAPVIALLAEWGIDASRVSADNWDAGGYEEFVMGSDGRRSYDSNDLLVTVRREWPAGFPVETLQSLIPR